MIQTLQAFIWLVLHYDYFAGHSFWTTWRIFHELELAER
jgi:hypothetical protein